MSHGTLCTRAMSHELCVCVSTYVLSVPWHTFFICIHGSAVTSSFFSILHVYTWEWRDFVCLVSHDTHFRMYTWEWRDFVFFSFSYVYMGVTWLRVLSVRWHTFFICIHGSDVTSSAWYVSCICDRCVSCTHESWDVILSVIHMYMRWMSDTYTYECCDT